MKCKRRRRNPRMKKRREAIEHHLDDMCLMDVFLVLLHCFLYLFSSPGKRCQTFLVVTSGNKNKECQTFLRHAKRAMDVLRVAAWLRCVNLRPLFFLVSGGRYRKKPCLEGSVFSSSYSRFLGTLKQQRHCASPVSRLPILKERTLDCDKPFFYLNPTL